MKDSTAWSGRRSVGAYIHWHVRGGLESGLAAFQQVLWWTIELVGRDRRGLGIYICIFRMG